MTDPHADRDRSEPRGWSEDQLQPVEGAYGDAIGSLVDSAKAEAQVQRERDELKAENADLRAQVEELARSVGHDHVSAKYWRQAVHANYERDQLRAEVADLRAVAALLGDEVRRTEAERDALRAEVERLRLLLASETYRDEGGRILIDQMQRTEVERDHARDEVERLRSHKIADPDLRALHESAKAYSRSNAALREVWGYTHSTTLDWLIRQKRIGPVHRVTEERDHARVVATLLEGELARVESKVARVEAQHPRGETWYDPGEGEVTTDDDRIEDGCQRCGEPWPCATIAALARVEAKVVGALDGPGVPEATEGGA
ncbi:MAG TPA: hypothetical protein VFJ94_10675 [Intrasporangium sp.]|uniref:hypothetical protein n=1 Tax=Intrasporangium sp. TaxID=1925024 RepID=UPI002D79515C|nr:hypothetical protein [Intrasporangium sp.]HET7398974.1 hypothetical protein [Intrasporangium sp.]